MRDKMKRGMKSIQFQELGAKMDTAMPFRKKINEESFKNQQPKICEIALAQLESHWSHKRD